MKFNPVMVQGLKWGRILKNLSNGSQNHIEQQSNTLHI
jgi:hypothetical protein